MESNYRLKVKIGDHEFEAEGSAEDVRNQFQAFRELILHIPLQVASTQKENRPAEHQPEDVRPAKTDVSFDVNDLGRIMKVDARTVSLTVRPKSLEEGILLIVYGQKALRQNDSVTGAEIIDGLKTTGGLAFGRIDRVMEKIGKEGDVIVTGENRGKRYRMTNAGLTKAKQIATELLAIVA